LSRRLQGGKFPIVAAIELFAEHRDAAIEAVSKRIK
jgi:hypothetical protein